MSLRKAIDAMCKQCVYDPLAGGSWRRQTSECEVVDCALWEYRPLDSRAKSTQKKMFHGVHKEGCQCVVCRRKQA